MTELGDPAELMHLLEGWLHGTDITGLTLTRGRDRIRLQRVATHTGAVPVDPVVVKAPSVGVFLHGHPLQDRTLAQPGQAVRAGDTVGLLRIGAVLVPVEAPRDGTVRDVLAADGATVGYGTPLLRLEDAY